ncbi:hypothetical protein LCGC14_0377950 [marine sediment metagenome]|uniref:AAA+ ATPase domain-containing protein n=1 Tax=marine sediment metagenome TaxID=412755 RepID=A0A0F9TL89_9ZZZZ
MIEKLLTTVLEWISGVSGGNQFMAAAISAWVLGVATYLLRKVPTDIGRFTKKHLTTSITITSYHKSFYHLMQWLEANGYSKKFRRLKITNGNYGEDAPIKTVGYGRHLMWYCKTPLLIELTRVDTRTNSDKEEVVLSKLGRGHALFDKLLAEVKRCDDEDSNTMTMIRKYNKNECWSTSKQPRRNFNSIFLPIDLRRQLLDAIKKFKDSEQWYIEHGIPYQLGILLYGPPGTGKTSLIRAIAAHMNTGLAVLNSQQLAAVSDFENDKDIIVVEDIDSNLATAKRRTENDCEVGDNSKGVNSDAHVADAVKAENELRTIFGGGISGILNALDGISISHGRVIVMTTNHIKKLDSALLRPGRIDVKLELGYVTGEVFDEFALAFFGVGTAPKLGDPCRNVVIADLQNKVVMGDSLNEIIKFCYNTKIN